MILLEVFFLGTATLDESTLAVMTVFAIRYFKLY